VYGQGKEATEGIRAALPLMCFSETRVFNQGKSKSMRDVLSSAVWNLSCERGAD
jgi:hypothetical protein